MYLLSMSPFLSVPPHQTFTWSLPAFTLTAESVPPHSALTGCFLELSKPRTRSLRHRWC